MSWIHPLCLFVCSGWGRAGVVCHRALVPGYFTQFTTVYGERLSVHTPVCTAFGTNSFWQTFCVCVCMFRSHCSRSCWLLLPHPKLRPTQSTSWQTCCPRKCRKTLLNRTVADVVVLCVNETEWFFSGACKLMIWMSHTTDSLNQSDSLNNLSLCVCLKLNRWVISKHKLPSPLLNLVAMATLSSCHPML